MDLEMLRSELLRLIGLYEKRISRFLELMEDAKGKQDSKIEEYCHTLANIEDALCRHEARRRGLLLTEASVTATKLLGTSEVNPLYVNRDVVDIGFDETEVFGELRRHSREEEKKTVSVKRILDPIIGVKVKNEAVERLYGKIRAWASADYVSELSQKNKSRITEEGDRLGEDFAREMLLHFDGVMDHYRELLCELPTEEKALREEISRVEAALSEAGVIEQSRLSVRYTAEAVQDGIRFTCEKGYGRLRFVAVTSPAYVVPMFPYTNDEFSRVFAHSFGDYLESDESLTVSWANCDAPLLRYVYPVAEFSHNTVVFPPRYIGDVTPGEGEVEYTVDDSALRIIDFCGYGFEDMIFATDEESYVTSVEEIDDHPAMRAMLCRRDAAGNFVIPLEGGIHNISLIGMDGDCRVARTLPQVYIGESIPVLYSVTMKKIRAGKDSVEVSVVFSIECCGGFENIAGKRIPPIVVRGGEYAPLTRDQGRLVLEADSVVFTEEKGSYRAEVVTVVNGVDPKYDKLSVFFKEPTNIYQLKKV